MKHERMELRGSPPVEQAVGAFHAATGRWKGCDWDTAFGPRSLNLNGLTSRQANLLANATAGDEAQAWRDAASWLTRVEQDARDAEAAAVQAVAAAQRGDWQSAQSYAEAACAMETYARGRTWNDLLIAIRGIRWQTG